MSLIKCSECGGTVSSMAKACPHCGCPISMMNTQTCRIKGREYDLSNVMSLVRAGNTPDNRLKGVRLIQSITGLDVGDAKGIWDEMVKIKNVPQTFQTYKERQSANLPKCPVCGSSRLTKISAVGRLATGFVFGGLSPEGRAQYVCQSCNYKF